MPFEAVCLFTVGCPAYLVGRFVSHRQMTLVTKDRLAEFAAVVAMFFAIFITNLHQAVPLSTLEQLFAWATAGFCVGLAIRLVSHNDKRGTSQSAREWKKHEKQQKLDRIPRKPVRIADAFDVRQLKETCQREEFIKFSLQHRLHWRTIGLVKDDASISNLLVARRRLWTAVTDSNQMKSLVAVCVVMGIAFGGAIWLMNVPVAWWLLMLVATGCFFAFFFALHLYSNLAQPRPQDVELDFESGVINWKSEQGSHCRPLSEIKHFSVTLSESPASGNGAALTAHFAGDINRPILATPRHLGSDEALARLVPFARVLAEKLDITEQHKQFGRDHAADAYVPPWIPQWLIQPKYVFAVITTPTVYYAFLFWSSL